MNIVRMYQVPVDETQRTGPWSCPDQSDTIPPTGNPATAQSDPVELPVLDSVDVKTLELLARKPGVAHSQYDLLSAGDRKTIGGRLRRLRNIGYVAYPEGKKRGNVITVAGMARLQSLAQSSP